ncbi:MAG: UbiA prenyltransferase family protein [Halobacteriota archaeon]|nr:UbiA prenyltransferase family protein [Halobacteriota archaeon]
MLRIRDWIKFYPFIPLIGVVLAGPEVVDPGLLLIVFIIFFCVTSYGFVINNYYDCELDRSHSEKVSTNKNPLVSGDVTPKGTLVLCALLVFVSLILSESLSIYGLIFTSLSIVMYTLYSEEHVRLKEIYLVDVIVHGGMTGVFPFLAGFTLAGGKINMQIAPIIFLFMALGSEALLTHQINDYRVDMGNTMTTVVRSGRRNGWILLAFFTVLSIVSLIISNIFFNFPLILTMVAFAYLVIYPIYMCRGVLSYDINNHPGVE